MMIPSPTAQAVTIPGIAIARLRSAALAGDGLDEPVECVHPADTHDHAPHETTVHVAGLLSAEGPPQPGEHPGSDGPGNKGAVSGGLRPRRQAGADAESVLADR